MKTQDETIVITMNSREHRILRNLDRLEKVLEETKNKADLPPIPEVMKPALKEFFDPRRHFPQDKK